MPEKEVKPSSPKFELLPEKWDMESIIEHVIIHYRFIFVMFLLPASFVYDLWFYARSKIVFALSSAPKKHKEKVADIQKQVREYQTDGDGKGMCTARPGWQTISPQNMEYKNKMYPIKINLVDILEIDTDRRTVRCEPLVTMGQLTATLDQLGWTIPIVPELDDLTIGGLVMGTGIETSSHRFGLFQHICKSYELVLADGSLVECSPYTDPELFYSIPWSYGTLGFLTSVEIEIIPSRRFVRLDYIPVYSLEQMVETFEREVERSDSANFVECLVYSREKAVVMTGNLVDCCEPGKLNEIGQWYKPWFFKHVEGFFETGPRTEYIPLRQYYHRHSRSIFWELQDIIPFGNNVVFRYLFGWLVPPKVSLLKLTQGKTLKRLYETKHMIQDMLVPLPDLKASIELFHREVEIYPIWLCPFRLSAQAGMLSSPSNRDEMFVDVGVYGVPKNDRFDAERTTRKIEEFVRNVSGFQMMYADSYMTRDEFRAMFDHTLYDRVREKLGCKGNFPEVYDKVNKKARSGPLKDLQKKIKRKFEKIVD